MSVNLTPKDTTEVEQVELFTLNGRPYTIPKRPRVNLALKYLKMAREQGAEQASAFLVEELLGEEAYEALMDYDDLTAEELSQIVEVAQKVVLGGLEA